MLEHYIYQKLFGGKCLWTIAVAHAISGCDTTSRLHVIGKGFALKQLLTKNSLSLTASDVFFNRESLTSEIVQAGGQAIVALYGGITNDVNLDKFR